MTDRKHSFGFGKVEPANPRPCSACPWRTENQGTPHPHGWYTKANLARLWSQLRRGEMMSCHPTDPSNVVPEGGRQVAEGTQVHECAGALVLQQRELMKMQTYPTPCFKYYRRENPRGLTKEGAAEIVWRASMGGVPMIGGPKMAKLDLDEPVGYQPLGEWDSEAVFKAVEEMRTREGTPEVRS